MKNAESMRKIAEEVQVEERKMVETLVYKYLEKVIAPLIEKTANDGKMMTKVSLNTFVDQNLLEEKLRFLGYKILRITNRTILISWE